VALPEAVANTPEMYTYDEMLSDLEALKTQYGSLVLDADGTVHSPEEEAPESRGLLHIYCLKD
jgi:hypothetical protein